MPETFTPFTWVDGSGGGTPLTAAQMNRLETGLESMDDRVAALEAGSSGTAIAATLVDAKGDLIAATAPDTVTRVAVGTDGQVLTANSATTTGLAWTTVSGGGGGASTTITHNTQTGLTYTLVLADAGALVEMTNAAANTITVPTNATAAFPVGTFVSVRQYGAGQTTIAPASGTVVVRAYAGGLKLGGQYAEATLTKRATNEWVLAGETAV